MHSELKPGDRVRVRSANVLPGLQPGATGTIEQGPFTSLIGRPYYVVRMDEDVGDGLIVVMAGEIVVVN
jgi:hypothetical protein